MIALAVLDARLVRAADGLALPNGMLVTPDDSTLIVAESYAKMPTAFEIAADGSLSNRRVWADVGDDGPDGICLDAENAVWYGDVPNKQAYAFARGRCPANDRARSRLLRLRARGDLTGRRSS